MFSKTNANAVQRNSDNSENRWNYAAHVMFTSSSYAKTWVENVWLWYPQKCGIYIKYGMKKKEKIYIEISIYILTFFPRLFYTPSLFILF